MTTKKTRLVHTCLAFLPLLVVVVFIAVHIMRNNHFLHLYENPPVGRKLFLGGSGTPTFNPNTGRIDVELPPGHKDYVFEITPNDIIRRTGPWYWRFFQWGVRTDGRTRWVEKLSYDMNISEAIARATDITNPTPFMFIILFCVISIKSLKNKGEGIGASP